MSWLRDRLPTRALDQVRLATTVFALLNVMIMVPLQLPHLSVLKRELGIGAGVLIVAGILATYLRRRSFWGEPILAGPLVFALGLYVDSASGLIGFAIAAVTAQALYGSARRMLVRSGGVLVATAALVLLPPSLLGRPSVSDGTPAVIVLLVPILFAGFARLVGRALLLLEQASKREALLADIGGRLAGLTEAVAVRAVLQQAGEALCALTPGLAVLVIRSDRQQAIIEAAYGLPRKSLGLSLPLSWLAGVDPGNVGQVQRLPEVTVDPLVWRRSGWSALGLGTQDADRYVLVATSARRVSVGVLDTVRTLSTQRSLAEANCSAHAELTHLAHRDQLTTTPNRRAFLALLAAAVDLAEPGGGAELALLIIDLDDFKQVNDTLGHPAGDELLIEVADRLRSIAGESGVASRLGGDEFAILLTDLPSQAAADDVADRVLRRLQEPVQLTQGLVTVGGSVGLAGGTAGATVEDLMRCADIAMYSAKAGGKNRVERFTEERHGKVAQLRQLENDFADLIARDEIVLHYQPLFDLKTGRVMGGEALTRWRHPNLGLLLPEQFMHVAERHGELPELSAHILRLACRQLMTWSAREADRDLRMSVNVSSRLLLVPGFDQVVREILAETAMPAGRLSLEFSESEVLDQDSARAQLAAIAGLGVRIALDDFGAGNISLANLRALRLTQLKIDCRVFGEIDGSSTDTIHLIMSVSRFLKLETVAKKIETESQLNWARREGLTLGQGFHLGPPVPAEHFDQWLANPGQDAERKGLPL